MNCTKLAIPKDYWRVWSVFHTQRISRNCSFMVNSFTVNSMPGSVPPPLDSGRSRLPRQPSATLWPRHTPD